MLNVHDASALDQAWPASGPLVRAAPNEIIVVDDDAEICDALSIALTAEGYRVVTFRDGTHFLAAARSRSPVCVLLDVCMPDKSGLDILKEIDAAAYPAPILVMSSRGNIATAVAAIRNGACDFVEKQTGLASVVARVGHTIENWARRRQRDASGEAAPSFRGYERLTPRERDVLNQITAAASSKEAAKALGISPRTVESHRVHIMKKLGAKNMVDLALIVMTKDGGR